MSEGSAGYSTVLEVPVSRLAGRVCVVNGAASEIGQAVAKRFASEGGVVAGVDKVGHAVGDHIVQADLGDEPQVEAMYEQVVYDEAGQLVTGTFVDYALPTAAEMPTFETDRTETPSPVNSMGVKGVGEAGTIAASPTIVNAVVDALRPLGVTFMDMPLTPMRVWQAIEEAKA